MKASGRSLSHLPRRRSGPLARAFNLFASAALVLLSSVIMVQFVASDKDSALNFAPFYLFGLFFVGGVIFSGREGKRITIQGTLVLLFIVVVLPLCIFAYAAWWANIPEGFTPD